MQNVWEQHRFKRHRVRKLTDIEGKLWEMEHEPTGAKLIWLENDDENQTFAISFRTVPTDSTGVFHILEHSVLCGSEKYPVKEPFVELMKSSLKTFLNAMTFPDKTVYPVSSRNRQDFYNLVSVYLDAVFHPAVRKTPEIFRQEGWHYELKEDGMPFYQGVVYNEMKGAYSNVGALMERKMQQKLFPDNCYGKDSGGNPEYIPELTYEQFLESYQSFYHPSNAQIILCGKIDVAVILELIDNVLAEFGREEKCFPIPMQEPKAYTEEIVPYEIGAGEDTAGKTMVSKGCLFATFADQEKHFAARLLGDYLADGNEAPLKQAILRRGLGADVSVRIREGLKQSWIGWEVLNTDLEKLAEIKEAVDSTLAQIADEGLDRERLEAYYNRLSFGLRDRDGGGQQGVYDCICILGSLLYGGDPAQNLSYQQVLESLREKLDTDYFSQMIRDYLLQTEHGALLQFVPSRTLGDEKQKAEAKRVKTAWQAMTDTERKQAKADNERLHIWQQAPDSEDALRSVPVLRVSDIPEKSVPIAVEQEKLGDSVVLRHHLDSGIAHMKLFFSASDLTREELPLAAFLSTLLGKLPTRRHSSAQLQTLVTKTIGYLNLFVDVYGEGTEKCRVYFVVHSASLPEQQKYAADLVGEILQETLYENEELVRDILQQQRNNRQRALISAGNQYAASRVSARRTAAGAAAEYLSGCEYISWLNTVCGWEKGQLKKLLNDLCFLAKKLFVHERLTFSVSDRVENGILNGLAERIPSDPEEIGAPDEWGTFPKLEPQREGILVPAGVGYAVKGGNLASFGKTFDGRIYVLNKVLSLQYLWNAIRVQGGAYGAGFYSADNGDLTYYTYRDPNPARSLECFDQSAKVLREFCASDSDLDKFILGAIADADPMRSSSEKMRLAESRYFKGITHEEAERIRRELLHTTKENLLELADVLEMLAGTDNICVVGGQTQLEGCKEQLTAVHEILK